MKDLEMFDEGQIMSVNRMVDMAEDIVSESYKMSASQWLRNRYDVVTLSQLTESEIVFGPFAQIVKYSGQRKESQLGSGVFDYYRICLQDHSILSALRENSELSLEPLILYVITHELIHIVRFGQFIQSFDAKDEQRAREESTVHRATVETLKNIHMKGMTDVFRFYEIHKEK